ncbi:MAG TPA: tetratricopeptide repeat protein [Pseudorhizobium sp.]|nr:tetratricopeptide repeat protein [Pseudorhizobium sp.]
MRRMVLSVVLLAVGIPAGCATNQKPEVQTLRAPAGTPAAVTQKMERGNEMFAAQDWKGAKEIYAAAIAVDASLAEAHYNLGLTLDQLGEKAEARKHFVQAANLAPGNKVIWDAPPLRKFDQDQELSKKSFLDPKPH